MAKLCPKEETRMHERRADSRSDGRLRADRRIVLQEYAGWFRCFPWGWYITATFDREVTGVRAGELLRRFIDEIERERRCALSALVVMESKWSGLGKPHSGFHFHLLLRAPEHVSAQFLKESWEAKHYGGTRCRRKGLGKCVCGNCEGGAMRVCRYNPEGRAAEYLFKNLQSDPDAWFLHREHLLGVKPSSWHHSGQLRDSVRRHERVLAASVGER